MLVKENDAVFTQLGTLALGSRLKRLSDKIMLDGGKIYQHMAIPFEPRWFPLTYLLSVQPKPVSISDLASQLGLSHPAVIQVVQDMDSQQMLDCTPDATDKRKKMVALSTKGLQVWQQAQPALRLIEKSLNTIFDMPNFLDNLTQLENQLNQNGFYNQAVRFFEEVRIVEYAPEYKPHFKLLFESWLVQHFKLEEPDKIILNDPETHIIAKGGQIFFAVKENQVMGTCALIPHPADNSLELTKMIVETQSRGQKIGEKLMQACIDKAKDLKVNILWLETNSTLSPAIRLYEKMGFQHVGRDPNSHYERADVKMVMQIN